MSQAQRAVIALCACLVIWLGLIGDSAARSHDPKPKPQGKATQLSEQQRPAQPSPPSDVLTPQQIEQSITNGVDAAAKQYETRHPATPPDNSGWWFNFLLVVFTAGLVVVGAGQGFLTFFTLKATQVAAKAAQTAAEAIQIIERPYIFIWGMVSAVPTVVFSSSTDPNSRKIIQDKAAFSYSISNRGKLAAVIENVSIAVGYERNGFDPPLTSIGDHYLLKVPIISAERDVENIPYNIPWRELDRTSTDPEFRDGLIFRVVIEYRGPFTKGHETSQCWIYRKAVDGWAEVPRYTYSRQRPERSEV